MITRCSVSKKPRAVQPDVYMVFGLLQEYTKY